ncbi:uncharacterized protein BDR25DRAFT_362516 [Lindgomyces ingoldianus]|uniref:Uncharacterized protein n=1 Tax=Lindgomyces ingoldianus TaxID=673940 RepID=A0ACB6Q9T2_9PLEO|nr:uncharacterized protein BDR25DRAFT_362516 [Lindgomyces ingoldianus]KAF2463714.1 hypothetical protein BDR25DRAFT_362516 [Lindgomyces ingoldianus]
MRTVVETCVNNELRVTASRLWELNAPRHRIRLLGWSTTSLPCRLVCWVIRVCRFGKQWITLPVPLAAHIVLEGTQVNSLNDRLRHHQHDLLSIFCSPIAIAADKAHAEAVVLCYAPLCNPLCKIVKGDSEQRCLPLPGWTLRLSGGSHARGLGDEHIRNGGIVELSNGGPSRDMLGSDTGTDDRIWGSPLERNNPARFTPASSYHSLLSFVRPTPHLQRFRNPKPPCRKVSAKRTSSLNLTACPDLYQEIPVNLELDCDAQQSDQQVPPPWRRPPHQKLWASNSARHEQPDFTQRRCWRRVQVNTPILCVPQGAGTSDRSPYFSSCSLPTAF